MTLKTLLPASLCALLLLTLGASPAPTMLDGEGTGSLTVTVLDAKDQPVAGTPVGVYAKMKPGKATDAPGGSSSPTAKSVIGIETPTMLQKASTMVVTMKTSDKGIAEFKTIKVGTYELRCGNPQKTGFKREAVTVEAGKPVAITVKLNPPGQGAGK